MMKIRILAAMALLLAVGSLSSFAQTSGEAVYKAKCQGCHGAAGLAETTVGKALHVKSATDPEVKKMPRAAMIDATVKGMGKMQPFKDKLSADEISAAVDYFRAFAK